jgi:capsular polysaccharide transport system permease protein
MTRFIMLGLVLNKPLLGYPIVKPMDLLLARAVLEVLSAGLVATIMMLIYAMLDIPFFPSDPLQALAAMGASMLLGLGFGLINGVIAGLYPFWITGYALFALIMWIASGVMIVPDSLPETARYWLSFNPALQGVEWMRSAYYDGYGSGVLDKPYMLTFAICAVFGGFVLERATRGQILK